MTTAMYWFVGFIFLVLVVLLCRLYGCYMDAETECGVLTVENARLRDENADLRARHHLEPAISLQGGAR